MDCGVFHSLIVKKILHTNFGTSLSDADVSLTIKTSIFQSKKISNDQELIQSDPTSFPQNQKVNN